MVFGPTIVSFVIARREDGKARSTDDEDVEEEEEGTMARPLMMDDDDEFVVRRSLAAVRVAVGRPFRRERRRETPREGEDGDGVVAVRDVFESVLRRVLRRRGVRSAGRAPRGVGGERVLPPRGVVRVRAVPAVHHAQAEDGGVTNGWKRRNSLLIFLLGH